MSHPTPSLSVRTQTPLPEKQVREPIACPVTGTLIARLDRESGTLYLWCKRASCKGWHAYRLADLAARPDET